MIVGASALLAILRVEQKAAAWSDQATIVIDGSRDPIVSRRFDDLLPSLFWKEHRTPRKAQSRRLLCLRSCKERRLATPFQGERLRD